MVYINENPKGGLQFQAWLDPEAQMSFSLYYLSSVACLFAQFLTGSLDLGDNMNENQSLALAKLFRERAITVAQETACGGHLSLLPE